MFAGWQTNLVSSPSVLDRNGTARSSSVAATGLSMRCARSQLHQKSSASGQAMSFSAHRRDALDRDLPLSNRASHARSCAVHVAEKWRIKRSVVLIAVHQRCGVDLTAVGADVEIETAIRVLEDLKVHGLPRTDDAEPIYCPPSQERTPRTGEES